MILRLKHPKRMIVVSIELKDKDPVGKFLIFSSPPHEKIKYENADSKKQLKPKNNGKSEFEGEFLSSSVYVCVHCIMIGGCKKIQLSEQPLFY